MQRRAAALTTALVLLTLGSGARAAGSGGGLWTSAGQDLGNTRHQTSEIKITPTTVGSLQPKWIFTSAGDVSATPAVDGSKVYFPDWTGNLYAVDRRTGQQVWKASIPGASGVPGDKARATPVVSGNKVIVGTQGPFGGGGKMLAFDKTTGAVLWSTQVESHVAAIITQSAIVFDGRVYVGTASQEEALAAQGVSGGLYPCCSFRGSVAALDLETGVILWKTFMVPPGYTGGAVWGSTPAVDPRRGQLYVATGNNYSIPPDAQACVAAAGGDPALTQGCIAPDDHFDSVVALDLRTGAIRWASRALPFDAWTVDCIPFFGDGDNCPEPAGPDYDFGQGPSLFSTGKGREFLGAGQKSGQYWALDPATGEVRWVTQAGPGGTAGGLQWGSAVDGTRVYTANANSNFRPWTLPSGSTVNWGMWSGLDAETGQLLWQTAAPDFGGTSGPVTTTNGVVFGCSLDAAGHMYALDGATGAILWSFVSGGSCLSGAAISGGDVYWGSGYSNFGFGTPNNKVYAFTVR
jgi:polyvinyl alcohol dehydrogenase (cytochrome)